MVQGRDSRTASERTADIGRRRGQRYEEPGNAGGGKGPCSVSLGRRKGAGDWR